MERLVWWMNRPGGRMARMGAGAAIVVAGVVAGGATGVIVAVIGLVPLAAGAGARCLLAPAFGFPMRGDGRPDKAADR